MTKEEVYNQLKPYGCISVYFTGSTANLYIENPRDTEFCAVFETYEQAKSAKRIYNVHNVSKGFIPKRYFIWGYVFHFLNESSDYIGEKIQWNEPTVELLNAMADGIINSKNYYLEKKYKFFYHLAMVKAINKYGYDDIPEKVIKQINDIHDLKMSYNEFKLED